MTGERLTGRLPLGLPPTIRACLFDLDGVLTRTERVHAAAWKQMFDDYLRVRAERDGAPFVPFEDRDDYLRFVDGKPRDAGVRSFLDARGIELPEGARDDPAWRETVHGLGNRKNALVLALLARIGVEVYEGSVRYVHAARKAGLRCGVVSSSANCRDVLATANLTALFGVVIDGVDAVEQRLGGKPAPDAYLAAAHALGVPATEAAVFEDAEAGVEAGRAGGFGFVVGVDRGDGVDALRAHGADVVVGDLEELLAER
jgi:beta-phosphoglucomutase family hydrolase